MNRRSIRSTSRAALLAVLFGALGALPAAAQATPDEAAAKARYAEAQGFYDTGRFDEALKGFSAAYELKPLPGFLFNIGQCHRQLGNWERARFFYRRYLDVSPTRPKNAAQVESLLKQADVKLAQMEDKRRREERAAKLENERKQAELDRKKQQADLEAARAQAVLDQQKKDAEVVQVRRLAAIEAESAAQRAELARSLKEAPPAPATPLYKKWWVWTGAAVLVAGGAAAWVATAPRPSPTSLGEASLR